MPRYNYICKDCIAVGEKKLGRALTEEEQSSILFEVSHCMFPTKKELKAVTQCPFCDSYNTTITLLDTNQSMRVRGGDWNEFRKKNAKALQRDMALHQLQNDDPYGYMRPAGDKEELTDKLRNGGKRHTEQKHFLM
jgi:hypothetical protein